MSFVDPCDLILTDDENDNKYWRFVGQDWKWMYLTDEDHEWCEHVGHARENSRKGSKNNFAKGSSLENDIHGACGELIVSRFFNQPVTQTTVLKDRHAADVGDFDVKSTKYKSNWRIYVNESTMKRDRSYILVMTAFYPKAAAILGWIHGSQIRNGPEKLSFRSRELAYWASWHELTTF